MDSNISGPTLCPTDDSAGVDMLEMIQGAYNGLKTASDLAQGIIALKTETEKNAAIIGIQRHVLDGQRALMEADTLHVADLKRIAQLEQQIADMENWEGEKQRYELKAIDRGAFAYMHKPGMEQGEPPMWFCQPCFEKSHRSPLQARGQVRAPAGGRGMVEQWVCNSCRAEVVAHINRNPATAWNPQPLDPAPSPPTVERRDGTWTSARRG